MNIYIDAEKAYKENNFSEALMLYNKLIKEKPDDILAYQGAAQCLLQLKKVNEAITACQEALKLDDKLPHVHLILASIYNNLNNRAESRKEIEIALNLDPNSAEVLGYYGTSLLMDNKLDEAISYLERSLDVDNNDYVFHYNLAIAYAKIKKWRETIRELKEVNKLHPSSKIRFQIATIYIDRLKIIGSIGFLFLLVTIGAVIFSKWGLLIISAFCLLFLLILDRVVKKVQNISFQ